MKWAIVGASDIASTRVIPAMRELGHEVVGVMSADSERAGRFALANAIPRSTTTLEQVTSWGADAGYISTTNQLHAEQSITCTSSGMHVLCEKPLALSVRDATSMIASAHDADVVLATNHHIRNKGTVRLIKHLVASGELGELLAVRLQHAGSLPERLRGWRLNDASAGGGVVLDITVHDADTLRFVSGAEITQVSATTASQGLGTAGIADTAIVTMRLDSGALGVAHESFVVPHAINGLEVHGSEGSIYADGALTQSSDGEVSLRRDGQSRQLEVTERTDVYVVGLREFEAATHGMGKPSATADDGFQSMLVALAAARSAEESRVVRVSELCDETP